MKTNPDDTAGTMTHQDFVHTGVTRVCRGLTKREDFAKAALVGLLSDSDGYYKCGDDAVKAADDLIEALNK